MQDITRAKLGKSKVNKSLTQKYLPLGIFAFLMIGLGVSDSLRGIFLPVFKDTFTLNNTQTSMIITVSYIGNLFFLLIGGYLVDKYNKKTMFLCIMTMWMSALLLFSLTENYFLILVGVFFSMGGSTLLSTMINLISPVLFVMYQGFIINVLGFIQGIGTSFTQNVIGKYANGFEVWQKVNIVLIILGVILMIGTIFANFKGEEDVIESEVTKEKLNLKEIIKSKSFMFITIIFGFYFIAEHGVMNWFVSYGEQVLGMDRGRAAMYLSIFFMGLTIGRLIFAPLVDKLGSQRIILIFSSVATVFYVIGSILGNKFIILLSISGIFFSILYPTLVLIIRKFYSKDVLASVTGAVISVATLFDIGFNFLFGKLIDTIGFKLSYLILPSCMILFLITYVVFYNKYCKADVKSN